LKTITVIPPTAHIIVGGNKSFVAKTLDQFNHAISAIVTWASSNTSVGTIDSTGKFTALEKGTTTITAANGTINGSASITVMVPTSTCKDKNHIENNHRQFKEKKEKKHIEDEEDQEDEGELEDENNED